MNPLSIRLLNQQLFAQQFSTPTEVVRYMGAMQAQEYHLYYKEILSLGRRIKILFANAPSTINYISVQ